MTQNREAPAYQEYAAQMMARMEFRLMSLAGRGLLYTLRNECWVNGSMPADPDLLARAIGFPVDEVVSALREVKPFFREHDGQLRCVELDDYRAHLERHRRRQSEGGRKGAEMTNRARSGDPTSDSAGDTAGDPRASRQPRRGSTRGSLVQNSQVQNRPIQALEGRADQEWVNDYERASRGQ